MSNKLIFMAGGGTAGHINPNLALVQPLQKAGYRVEYMGQTNEMESSLVTAAGLPFHRVAAGRLHRSLNPDTLLTPFRILKGIFQAIRVIRREKPALIFWEKAAAFSFPGMWSPTQTSGGQRP